MKRYLVTGGVGFLGRQIAERLAARGDAVRVLDAQSGEPPVGVEILRGDLRDSAATDRACAGVDGLFHVAAAFPPMPGNVIRDVNVSGTANLLDSAARAEVPEILFASSHTVYGRPPAVLPCPEDAPVNAAGPFSLSKVIGEEMVLAMREKYGARAAVIRPVHVLGPGYSVEQNLRFIYDRAIRNQPIFLAGRDGARRHYVDVEDLADAFIACLDNPAADGRIFNVGFAKPHTDREYARIVTRVGHSMSPIIPTPKFLVDIALRILALLDRAAAAPENRRAAFTDAYYDISKATQLLGWAPRKKLSDSVADTMRWYKRKKINTDFRNTLPI